MEDLYVECLVARKPKPTDALIRGAVIGLTVLMGLAGILLYPVFLLGALAGGLCIYFLLPNLSVEYEYLYISKTIQVDKILSRQKRKKVVEYDLEQMEIFAQKGAWQLDEYKNRKMTERDYSSKTEGADLWIMVVRNGQGMERAVLEPNEAMIKAVAGAFPRKTFRKA